jgi:hypothetical protein
MGCVVCAMWVVVYVVLSGAGKVESGCWQKGYRCGRLTGVD